VREEEIVEVSLLGRKNQMRKSIFHPLRASHLVGIRKHDFPWKGICT
jgi:hypothetical protein